jgi:tripartite-type tricarboxylate transporter receptor subunit TctC
MRLLRGSEAVCGRPAYQTVFRFKQLRPIIIFAHKRHPAFPDVPCSVELGYELTLPQFRSIVAKAGTPPDRVKILAEAFQKAMETPEWKKFADDQYLDPESYMGPDKLKPVFRDHA